MKQSSDSATTRKLRQQAVVATVLAYFDKGHSVQYDGKCIVDAIPRADGGKTRSTNQEPPEFATPYETLFSVCSDFAHQVFWDVFGYQLCGSPGICWTGAILNTSNDDPMLIYSWEKKDGKEVHEALAEVYQLAQPGDIFTAMTEGEFGHTMIYLGDALGDGKTTHFGHCFGGHMDLKTGRDTREYALKDVSKRIYAVKPFKVDKRYGESRWKDNNNGSIRLTPDAGGYLQRAYGKGDQAVFNLIRPFNAMPEEDYPVSAAAKYRIAHPRLAIDRMVKGKTRFCSAYPGETLTLTVTLSNSSKTAYTVSVTEPVPQGAALCGVSEGGAVSDGAVRWEVPLSAGESKTLFYKCKITAARGEKIVFNGGFVGDIPSNTIPITVGGKKLTAAEKKTLKAVASGAYDEILRGVKGAELADTVYRKILGLRVELPKAAQIAKNLTEKRVFSDGTTALVLQDKEHCKEEDRFAAQMLVPMLHGGMQLWNRWGHERCNEPKDICVEPGDVIVRLKNAETAARTDTLIYLGGGKYLRYDPQKKGCVITEEPEFVRSLIFGMFYCLRPTLAYDDIHSRKTRRKAGAAGTAG